ncbi:MAG: hypothetical protein ABI056_02590 [Caulobacteraceae bacterium]
MRNLFAVMFGVSAAVFAATPLTAQTPHPQPPSSGPEPAPPQLENPDKAGSANVQNAAEAPLHDLNLVRQKIPPILLTALAEPYARPRFFNCRGIYFEVNQLQQALGGDFDEPDNPQNPSLTTQRGIALTIVHGASELLLPFAGFVRTLSGAQKHDQLVVEVITAGSVRRAYLKGLGEAYGCAPPAAPRHRLVPPVPIPESRKPEYPSH